MTTTVTSGHARAAAIRALLSQPLLLRQHDEVMFREVAAQRGWLQPWFRDNLGWALQVDVRAGVARLHKRSQPNARRGLKQSRNSKRPFDAFRYQLMALSCAELLQRSPATIGDLADALARQCANDDRLTPFDATVHTHRLAFVDVLLWLQEVGAVTVTAGHLEGFSAGSEAAAVLKSEAQVMVRLLSSDTPPSRLDSSDTANFLAALTREPRYGSEVDVVQHPPRTTGSHAQRTRWARHHVTRRLLDDAAMDIHTLPDAARNYLLTPAGRHKVAAVVDDADLQLERHADVWLAIDPSGQASRGHFAHGGNSTTAEQAAAVLLDALVTRNAQGLRNLTRKPHSDLRRTLKRQLDRHPGWARSARSAAGLEQLLTQALQLLEEYDLVSIEHDAVVARPAAGRFALQLSTATKPTKGTASE